MASNWRRAAASLGSALVITLVNSAPAWADAQFTTVAAQGEVTADGDTFSDMSGVQTTFGTDGRVLFNPTALVDSQNVGGLWLFEAGKPSLVYAYGVGQPGIDERFQFLDGDFQHIDSAGVITASMRYYSTGSEIVGAFNGLPGALKPLLTLGDAVPGLADTVYDALGLRSFPEVDTTVLAATFGTVAGTPGARSWLVDGDGMQPFVFTGDAVPGSPGQTFTSAAAVLSITSAGRILFGASTSGTADTTANLFRATSKADITPVASIVSPPMPLAGKFSVPQAHLSDKGDLALVVAGKDADTKQDETALWYGKPGSLKLVARSTALTQASDATALGADIIKELQSDVELSLSGNVALVGRKDFSSGRALWVGLPDALHPILEENAPVSSAPGATCTSITHYQINDRGELAIVAELDTGAAIFRYSPSGGLELLASDGHTLSLDGSAQTVYGVSDALISQDGRVALFARRSSSAPDFEQMLILSDSSSVSPEVDEGGSAGLGIAAGGSTGGGSTGGGSTGGGSTAGGTGAAPGASGGAAAPSGGNSGGGCGIAHGTTNAPLVGFLSLLLLLSLRRRDQKRAR